MLVLLCLSVWSSVSCTRKTQYIIVYDDVSNNRGHYYINNGVRKGFGIFFFVKTERGPARKLDDNFRRNIQRSGLYFVENKNFFFFAINK